MLTPTILLHTLTVLSEAGSPATCIAVAQSWGGDSEGVHSNVSLLGKLPPIYPVLNQIAQVKKESGKYQLSFVNIYTQTNHSSSLFPVWR
jgi:hypothetical protein